MKHHVHWLILWTGLSLIALPGQTNALESVCIAQGATVSLPFNTVHRVQVVDSRVATARRITSGTVAVTGQIPGVTQLHVWSATGRETFTVRVERKTTPPTTLPLVRPVIINLPELVRGGTDGNDRDGEEPVAVVPPLVTVRRPPRLSLFQQVDKARTVYADLLSYTVECHNKGLTPAEKVEVRVKLPPEVEYLPDSAEPRGTYAEGERCLLWQMPKLEAGAQATLHYKARVTTSREGAQIQPIAQVQAAGLVTPVAATPVVTEVVSLPLLAAYALPDVIVARRNLLLPLLDIEQEAVQRTVDRLESLGIVHGFPDHSFRPHEFITRAQATKMIVLALNLEGLRDTTQIGFFLKRPAKVTVTIYNEAGEAVRHLLREERVETQDNTLVWDGLDDNGAAVPPGIYRYEVQAVGEDGISSTLTSTINLVAVRLLKVEDDIPFVDVSAQAWYAPYLAAAVAKGLVRGYPGNLFRPNLPIRRVEETVLIVRAAGLEKEARQRREAKLGFADEADIPRWAVGYIAVATTTGPRHNGELIVDYPGNTFLPQNPLTRSEAAALVERFLDRDAKRSLTVSGAVSMGTRLAINGRPVVSGQNGHFREEVTLQSATLNRLSVITP
ncbi:MAG TPA: DUF11 domain-containing protein [Armatimonadetes bacterium]|nr:DUF11 domain-containing protein [Armatimonadota bacterium]